MSDFLRDYLTVVWFAAIALVLAGLLLGISALLRPNKPSAEKNMAYESGVNPVGDGWSQSQVRYYIFALLFVVFDVEAVFIFPWATQLEVYGRLRPRRNGHLRLRPAPWPRVRVAQGRPALGVTTWVSSTKGVCPNHSRRCSTWAVPTACGCTSGASRAAPSRWAPPSARPATT